MQKKILFTFDYELFLGRESGQVDKSLIKPTKRLLRLLQKNDFKAIFFVDTVYLLRLKELAIIYAEAQNDYQEICDQLKEMHFAGHSIFLHIHPHWIDAIYNDRTNSWSLVNYSRYRFSSLGAVLQEDLFVRSVNILKEILNDGKELLLDGYRAGGWSIQPFSMFQPFFDKYNIRYEFSVIPGKWYYSDAQEYDYRTAPQKDRYNFSEDICRENQQGQYIEYPISILELSRFIGILSDKFFVLLFKLGLSFIKHMGNGSTIHIDNESGDIYNVGKKRIVASFESFDLISTYFQFKVIQRLDYCHFISHPKLLSPMNFYCASWLLKRLKRETGLETDFRKFDA